MKIYPVAIATPDGLKKYSTEFQIDNFEAFQKVLAKWHRKTHAVCLCPGKGEKKLAIKYLETTGTYYLARYPKSAEEHAEDCIYRLSATVISTGLKEKDKDIDTRGFISLRLSRTVAPRRKSETKKRKNPEDVLRQKAKAAQDNLRVRKTKSQVTLTDLLKLLWEKAGLNYWTPEKEKYVNSRYVFMKVRKVSTQIETGIYKLSTVLTISALTAKDIETNRKILDFVCERKARTVFVGILRKYVNTDIHTKTPPYILPVVDYSREIKVIVEKEIDQLLKNRFQKELDNWKSGLLTVFACVAEVEKDDEIYVLKPVDVALMNVSRRFIPVHSLYEAQLEEKLRKEGRKFKKPLISGKKDGILPDFILFDTEKPTYLEVFDGKDKDYEKQKRKKLEYCEKNKRFFRFREPLKKKRSSKNSARKE